MIGTFSYAPLLSWFRAEHETAGELLLLLLGREGHGQLRPAAVCTTLALHDSLGCTQCEATPFASIVLRCLVAD
jgi:hypothetical protein